MDSHITVREQVVHSKKECFSTLHNICKIRSLLTSYQLKTNVNSLVVSCLDKCKMLQPKLSPINASMAMLVKIWTMYIG